MKTILIADDEEDIRALLLMTLEDPAYRLIEASDGESALNLIKTDPPRCGDSRLDDAQEKWHRCRPRHARPSSAQTHSDHHADG